MGGARRELDPAAFVIECWPNIPAGVIAERFGFDVQAVRTQYAAVLDGWTRNPSFAAGPTVTLASAPSRVWGESAAFTLPAFPLPQAERVLSSQVVIRLIVAPVGGCAGQ